jgi:enterochelin esterase-like enzyme
MTAAQLDASMATPQYKSATRYGSIVFMLLAYVLTAATSPALAQPTPVPPFEIVQPASFDALRASVADRNDAISLDGDVLTIVHRDARDAVVIGGSLQMPMARAPGTDMWYLLLKRRDWDRSFFSYQFAASRATTLESGEMSEYRGPLAPILKRAATLKGRIVIRKISSKHLNEDRAVSVYLPPVTRRSLPVLFMTDGAVMEKFARVIEPLILGGAIEPIAIVGVHASTAPGTRPGIDGRSQEYVSLVAPDIAARHLQFFIDEVLPSMTSEYRLSERREDRAIFGFSNGAAFVTTVAARHGNLFSHALPFSFNLPKIESAKHDAPTYHFAAGELEPYFLAATRNAHEQLSTSGTSSNLHTYMSGHDVLMWQLALCEYLPGIFPAR